MPEETSTTSAGFAHPLEPNYDTPVFVTTATLPAVVSLEWATLQALEQRVAALEAQMDRVFKEAHGLK